MKKTLRIHPSDNLEVALTDLAAGEMVELDGERITLPREIPAKHKYAVQDLEEGADVIMYGVLVGRTILPVPRGTLISVDNIRHASEHFGFRNRKPDWTAPDISAWQGRSFYGYHRSDGSVGTANYWLIIPLVFCENANVQMLYEAFVKELGYEREISSVRSQVTSLVRLYRQGYDAKYVLASSLPWTENKTIVNSPVFPNITGVKLLTHGLGCGGTKEDAKGLCGLLAGYITNANVAGATVLSLGCQNAQIAMLSEEIRKRDPDFSKPLCILEQQEIGLEEKLLQQAVKQTFAGMMQANRITRMPAPLSKLCVGLECGGSDGFSGISANPALGHASDILVALGASVILSEFPELCGVEQELIDRCVDKGKADKFIQLMRDYQSLANLVGSGFDSNPSAGNITDGLITDAIKSAGAARKAGNSPVMDVLDYPEKVSRAGLNLLCTPGSDIESTTAEVGSGATVVVFTTGLGTPTGNPICPVIKVSTNSNLYHKMNDIIDLDAGTVITGDETPEAAGVRILEHIIRIASGEVFAHASLGGHDDFIPWKRGISL